MNAIVRQRGLISVFASGRGPNPADVLTELGQSFEAFRNKYDERQTAIEQSIDDLSAAVAAFRVGGVGTGGADSPPVSASTKREFYNALGQFVRDRASQAAFSAPKALGMSTDSDPDGGYMVEPVLSPTINRKIFDVSPIARLARRVTITTGDAFEEPIDPSDIGAEWVGERQSRPTTTTSTLQKLSVPVREIYTSQPVTQRLLDDSRFDVAGWLEGKISDKFARSEGSAYVSGNGVLRARGLLTYATSTATDASRDWFTIQYVPSGVAAALSDETHNGVDAIYSLVYSLRAPYRPNARFLMNLATAGVVRKLKDEQGRFLWAEAREGMPAMLAGFPVELDEEMPDIGAGQFPIAFGDIAQAYIVVQKPGIRMLRDPFTDKPNVLFYAYRRVGGGLQNGEAVKLLKIAAT